MFTQYIRAAMSHARYGIPEDGGYCGEMPGFDGVYAGCESLEVCRDELQSVLEGRLLLSFRRHLPVPVVDGIDLTTAGDAA